MCSEIQQFLQKRTENTDKTIYEKINLYQIKAKEKKDECKNIKNPFFTKANDINNQILGIDAVLKPKNTIAANNTEFNNTAFIESIERTICSFMDDYQKKMGAFYEEKNRKFIAVKEKTENEISECNSVIDTSSNNISKEFKELNKETSKCNVSVNKLSDQFQSTNNQSGHLGNKITHKNGQKQINDLVDQLNETIRLLEENEKNINQLVVDLKAIKSNAESIISDVENVKKEKNILNNNSFELIKKNLDDFDKKLDEINTIKGLNVNIKANALFSNNPQIYTSFIKSLEEAKQQILKLIECKIDVEFKTNQEELKQKMNNLDKNFAKTENLNQNIQEIDKCLSCMDNYINYIKHIPLRHKLKPNEIIKMKNEILIQYSDLFFKNCNSLIYTDMKKLYKNITQIHFDNQKFQNNKAILNFSNSYFFKYISKFSEEIKVYLNAYKKVNSISKKILNLKTNNNVKCYVVKDIHDKLYSILKELLSKDILDMKHTLNSKKNKIYNIKSYNNNPKNLFKYLNITKYSINYNSMLNKTLKDYTALKRTLDDLSKDYSTLKSMIENILDSHPVYLTFVQKIEIHNRFKSFDSEIEKKYSLDYELLNKKINAMLFFEARMLIATNVSYTFIQNNKKNSKIDKINLIIRNIEATKALSEIKKFLATEKAILSKDPQIKINISTIIEDCKKLF